MATWYGCLAHMNYHLIGELELMRVFVDDLPTPPCNTCAQGKAKWHVFRQAHRAAAALKLVYTNISGLIPATFSGKQYYVIFKDDYFSLKKPYFMKIKDETAKCFEEYKNLIENQLDTKIKCFWSDEGDEYAGTEFMSILKRAGIQWEPSALYMLVQNGIAECTHYLIFNAVWSIMIAMRLSKSLWTELVKVVCYICNWLSKKKESLAYEMIKKHKSDLTHLHTLECKVFVMLPKEWRGLKLDVKSWQGIHVGYEGSNQYCIYSSVIKHIGVY